LLAQHPRPSRFSGHDWRSGKKDKKIEELKTIGQHRTKTEQNQARNGRTR